MVINSEFDPMSDKIPYNPDAPLKSKQDAAKLPDLPKSPSLDDLEPSDAAGLPNDWRKRR